MVQTDRVLINWGLCHFSVFINDTSLHFTQSIEVENILYLIKEVNGGIKDRKAWEVEWGNAGSMRWPNVVKWSWSPHYNWVPVLNGSNSPLLSSSSPFVLTPVYSPDLSCSSSPLITVTTSFFSLPLLWFTHAIIAPLSFPFLIISEFTSFTTCADIIQSIFRHMETFCIQNFTESLLTFWYSSLCAVTICVHALSLIPSPLLSFSHSENVILKWQGVSQVTSGHW